MEERFYIPVLVGTARKNNLSDNVAKFVHHEIIRAGFESDCISPRDHLTYPVTTRAGIETKKKTSWQQTMSRASGLIIVTPEYNHSFPGELKLMLDMLYEEYQDKPVFICGVSDGPWGGVRVVEHLIPVLANFQMQILRAHVYFPNVDTLINKNTIKSDYHQEKLAKSLSQLRDALTQKN